ncbi:SufE family protein [Phaeovibrio sulfidiphilus]|uniref:SufE family protein n=1 Tax=Phaeovibrio sulfidiphilus TaxID=1220600 RepID=A0A8J7CNN4_9PROT|nr:SufE family protein [Phaeovibrio sulfidiphilus]MBE1236092.1 SufE family protein [Phaeovibrio sulfidiphilus]
MTELEALGADDLVETFGLFDDWEDRYRYLIDLGRKLPPFPEEARTDAARVPGCMSQVWLLPRVQDDPDGTRRLFFLVDSDAHIVRGLAAVMLVLYSGKTSDQILATDAERELSRMGLAAHISPNRRNGVASMEAVIKGCARRAGDR